VRSVARAAQARSARVWREGTFWAYEVLAWPQGNANKAENTVWSRACSRARRTALRGLGVMMCVHGSSEVDEVMSRTNIYLSGVKTCRPGMLFGDGRGRSASQSRRGRCPVPRFPFSPRSSRQTRLRPYPVVVHWRPSYVVKSAIHHGIGLGNLIRLTL